MLTTSSFSTSGPTETTTALLFPSFQRLAAIPHTPSSFSALATAYLKAPTLHPMHASLSPAQKALLTRDESAASKLPPPEPITRVTVLICGHGGRDERCGIMGPLLRTAFRGEFERKGVDADVGLISHIGGHKFAGNVIIYVPPGLALEGSANALAGCGVWYGRVGPEHVEGVVDETVVNGRVIEELFRGGITKDGEMLGRILEAQIKEERGEDDGGLKLRPRVRR
jgi:leucyl-tRNA synthetase